MRVQNDDLRTENTTLKEQNAGLETRCATFQEHLAQKQAQIDEVRAFLAQRNEEKTVLENRIQEVTARQHDLLARIDELEQQNQTFRDDADDFERERERLREVNRLIMRDLNILLEEVSLLRGRSESMMMLTNIPACSQLQNVEVDLREGQRIMEAQGKECNELLELLHSEEEMNDDVS